MTIKRLIVKIRLFPMGFRWWLIEKLIGKRSVIANCEIHARDSKVDSIISDRAEDNALIIVKSPVLIMSCSFKGNNVCAGIKN